MLKIPTITRPVRHLRRYRYIFSVFARHGFGFALSQLPLEPSWLRELAQQPEPEPASLPVHFRQALEELGPTFVKLGQMLSTRPDLLPPSYIAELTKLQDRVQPVSWEDIRAVLVAELAAQPDAVFAHIDPTPIASASLAQVHSAELHTGEKVVVKIQRPNILPTIRTDLEIIQDLAKYANQHTTLGRIYNTEEIAEDFSDTLNNELDYYREGRNADKFRRNFADESFLHIPWVYWEHTTQRVMVLERIEGIKIDQVAALDAAGYDRGKIADRAAHMIIKEILEDGFFHADPHPGNLVVMEGGIIGVMDFGMVGYLSDADRLNLIRLYTVAVRMDAEGVVDELVHIQAAPPDVNRRGLIRDIERVLRYYNGLPLKEIRANEVINDIMPIAFEYHLQLPPNLWLLGKTLAIMEGVGLLLNPEFDIFEFSGPYVTRLLMKSLIPKRRWVESTFRRALAWNDLFEEIPRAGRLLLDRFEKGAPIRVTFERDTLDRLDALITRLALSIIITGMIIGMAFIIPTAAGGALFIQISVGLGFALSVALGLYVLISIIRKP